jgi:DNA polymerase-1
MKRCQNEVYELLGSNPEYAKRAALIAQVHDEQIFELDDDPEFVARFVEEVKTLMEKPPLPDFPVPVVAEASMGYRWGDKMSVEKWLKLKEGESN